MTTTRLAGISRLRTTLKRRIDVHLGDLTFIVGPNESYKSTIAQSIELCLGRSLSLYGKMFTQPYKLRPLAAIPEQGIEIWAQSRDGEATFRLHGKDRDKEDAESATVPWTGQYATLSPAERSHIFPIPHVRTLLSYDPPKAREEIVRLFCTESEVRPPIALSAEQKRMWAEGLAATKGTKDPVGILAGISGWARVQKGQKTKEANQALAAASEAKELAETPGLEALDELEKRLVEAKAWENGATDRDALKEGEADLQVAQKETLRLRTILEESEAKLLADRRSKQGAILDKDTEIAKALATLEDFRIKHLTAERFLLSVQQQMAAKPGVCVFQHPAHNMQVVADSLVLREHQHGTKVLETDKTLTELQRQRDALERNLQEAEHLAEVTNVTIKADLQELAIRIAEIKAATNVAQRRLANAPKSYQGLSVDALEQKLTILREAKKARGKYEEAVRDRERLESESRACKRVEEAAIQEIQRLLRESKQAAETQVNTLMPETDRVILNLENEDCEWLVTGVDKRPHPRISQSGFQRGCLTLALAACLAKRSRLSILKIDDEDLVGFDGDHIVWLLERLEAMLGLGIFSQVIAVSNREDLLSRVPKAYTIIHCHKTDLEQSKRLGASAVGEILLA